MSIHKYGGKYLVKYTNKNKIRTTKRGFATKNEAKIFEAKIKLERISDCTNYTFNKVCDLYIEGHKVDWSYATYSKINGLVNTFIKPYFSNININTIDRNKCLDFKKFLSALCKESGKQYSTSHKNAILDRFGTIINYAFNEGYIDKNPYKGIGLLKLSANEIKTYQEKDANIWTIDEFQKFIKEVKDEDYKLFFTLLFFTGLRLGEALALTWDDFKDDSIKINKSVSRKTDNGSFEVKAPKTSSSIRAILLPNFLVEQFNKRYIRESSILGFNSSWFIFGRIKPLPQTSIDRNKDKAIKLSNVKRIRIHDFRHSHASNLIGGGMDIIAVSRRLGHSSINETLKTYSHLLKENDNKIVDMLNKSTISF